MLLTDTGETVVDDLSRGHAEAYLAAVEAVLEQAPVGFMLFDAGLRVLRVNGAIARATGRPVAAHVGLSVFDLLDAPREADEARRCDLLLHRVLKTGEPALDVRITGGRGQEPHQWLASVYRLQSADGEVIGVAAILADVTGRQRAEAEASAARRNLALLNQASAHIGSTLDLEVTARELLDVTVPHFCDLGSVDLYAGLLHGEEAPPRLGHDDSARLRRVAGADSVAVESAAGPNAVGSELSYPISSPYGRALATGETQLLGADDCPPPVLSALVVPLVARGVVLGLAQFCRVKGSKPFDRRDQALATELASRAAVCVDNARLYRREHDSALLLQHSLLPPGNPEADGLDIACRYLPAGASSEVGGDWFDVIPLPGHRTAVVVGDVMGRGLRAAVAMGELRTAVRTLALLDLEPAEVLSQLDEIAQGLGGQQQDRPAEQHGEGHADLAEIYLATCVYAVYDPVTQRCAIANAGHLPPVLVQPGERPLMLELPQGLPLGVGGEPFEETEVTLPDGALLALYTDGLVESRDHQLDEGLDALRDALAGPAPSLEDVCDHLLGELAPHRGEDDLALLLARVRALPEDSVGDWTLAAEPRSVSAARRLVRDRMTSWGLDDLSDVVELLASELITNSIRYGDGDVRLRLLLHRTLVCEVWDGALAQPRRRRALETDETGRGLQLVASLAERWGSRRTPRGKTVWFELPVPAGHTRA